MNVGISCRKLFMQYCKSKFAALIPSQRKAVYPGAYGFLHQFRMIRLFFAYKVLDELGVYLGNHLVNGLELG